MRLSLATPSGQLDVATRIAEAEMFQVAAAAAASSANAPHSIETIMRLAVQAQTDLVRRWAARWLDEHYGVSVGH